jgi:hypothetical protein
MSKKPVPIFANLVAATDRVVELERQLARANRIIGWMMPYIGGMCPPDDGLFELNKHCCENHVPDPKREKCDRPIKQSIRDTMLGQRS